MVSNRKPAHLEYVGGKSPRQRIWEKIRELRAFSLNDLIGSLPGDIDRTTTRTYVKSLVAGGFLSETLPQDAEKGRYALINDNGVEAPRVRQDGSLVTQGRAQENMWRTLRAIHHPVSHHELAGIASTQDHPVNPIAARDYLCNLNHAGYLDKSQGKYRLLPTMNTGPRPPMIQRIKQIYDPNLGKVMWTDGDEDHE